MEHVLSKPFPSASVIAMERSPSCMLTKKVRLGSNNQGNSALGCTCVIILFRMQQALGFGQSNTLQ